jgi:putative Holliday junction resolvase
MTANNENILGLDIGERRIGLARVNLEVKLPQPLGFLENNGSFIKELKKIVLKFNISTLVVGLPRNLDGEETAQTKYVKNFCDKKLKDLNITIALQDETLSTRVAQERLSQEGIKTNKTDAMAAAIILEDYLSSQREL